MHKVKIAAFLVMLFACQFFFFDTETWAKKTQSKSKVARLKMLWTWQSGTEAAMHMLRDANGADYLYVAMRQAGLQILQLDNKGPSVLASIPAKEMGGLDANYIVQDGNLLYIALGNTFHVKGDQCGLACVDITDPGKPRLLSFWHSKENTFGASCLLLDGDYLYLGAMARGLYIFDRKNRSSPELVGSFQPKPLIPVRSSGRTNHPNVRAMVLRGDLLYLCYDSGGLRILDLADRIHPRELSIYHNQAMKQQQAYNGIVVDYPYAYLAVDYAGLEVLDISNPSAPRQLHWYDPWQVSAGRNFWLGSGGHTNQMAYDSSKKQLFVSAGDSELLVFDMSKAEQPRLIKQFGEPKDHMGSWGLCLDQNIVYVSYIKAVLPFLSKWNGIVALSR